MLFEKLKLLDSGSGSTLEDYKFLYGFISLVKPHRILDIGTNHGLSAMVMAMALRDCGLKKSKILTIDINKNLLEIANAQICDLRLSRYIDIKCCDSSALDPNQFFDVVFIDGDHTFEGCMRDFYNVKNRANYILIHDTAHLEELSDAIKLIEDMGTYDVININDGKLGKQWSLNRVVYRSFPGISIIRRKQCLR